MSYNFVEWNYDNNIAMQYERTGQCNQCGGCCAAKIVLFTIPPMDDGDSTDSQEWWSRTDEKGIWNELSFYGARKFIKLEELGGTKKRCKRLTRSNKCLRRLFFAGESVICAGWPLSPKCIESFPNCGFVFVEKKCWAISENGKEKNEQIQGI